MRIGAQTRQSLQLSDSAVTFLDSAVSVVPLLLVDDKGMSKRQKKSSGAGTGAGEASAALETAAHELLCAVVKDTSDVVMKASGSGASKKVKAVVAKFVTMQDLMAIFLGFCPPSVAKARR